MMGDSWICGLVTGSLISCRNMFWSLSLCQMGPPESALGCTWQRDCAGFHHGHGQPGGEGFHHGEPEDFLHGVTGTGIVETGP